MKMAYNIYMDKSIIIIGALLLTACTSHQKTGEAISESENLLKAHEESVKRIISKRGNSQILTIKVPRPVKKAIEYDK